MTCWWNSAWQCDGSLAWAWKARQNLWWAFLLPSVVGMLCTAKHPGSLWYLGPFWILKRLGEKWKKKEKDVSVRSFSNRYGFSPVSGDLREGVGKGKEKKNQKRIITLSCSSFSCWAVTLVSVCSICMLKAEGWRRQNIDNWAEIIGYLDLERQSIKTEVSTHQAN